MLKLLENLEPVVYKGQKYYRQKDVMEQIRPGCAYSRRQARYYRQKITAELGRVWGEFLPLPCADGRLHSTWCVTPEEAEEMAERAVKNSRPTCKKAAAKNRRIKEKEIRCILTSSGTRFYPVIDIVKAKKPWLKYPEDAVRHLRMRINIQNASKHCGKDFYLCEPGEDIAVKAWCVTEWSRFEVEKMIEEG